MILFHIFKMKFSVWHSQENKKYRSNATTFQQVGNIIDQSKMGFQADLAETYPREIWYPPFEIMFSVPNVNVIDHITGLPDKICLIVFVDLRKLIANIKHN